MDQIVDRAQELRPDAVLIAGNHDSAHRLQYASSFLEKHQIYVDEMPLGMSDAIQSTAGRVRLDTIFVDEGFGSPDDESGGEAVKNLQELACDRQPCGMVKMTLHQMFIYKTLNL